MNYSIPPGGNYPSYPKHTRRPQAYSSDEEDNEIDLTVDPKSQYGGAVGPVYGGYHQQNQFGSGEFSHGGGYGSGVGRGGAGVGAVVGAGAGGYMGGDNMSFTDASGMSRPAIPRMASLYKVKSPDLLEDQRIDLRENGFPNGLAAELGKTRAIYPVRFWILDNSGSMMANDGWSIRGSTSVQCTRWAELQETVNYHANLAGILQATSIFRMLNDPGVRAGPQEFSIADQGKNYMEEIQSIKKIMQNSKPYGSTPLTQHLVEIAQRIAVTESRMRKKGLEAVVIIATDGLPTSPEGHTSEELNNQFISALQNLQSLPVWVVIRLCTDEKEVVDFYNHLDKVLELPLEVLDDFFNEAKEIQKHNKWLNYALPLHRCREIGYQHRIFDMLDERQLNKDELKEFCESVLGSEHFVHAPDVHNDWNGFLTLLNKILKSEQPQFNPITKKMAPWIDVKELKKAYSGGGILGMLKKKRTSLSRK